MSETQAEKEAKQRLRRVHASGYWSEERRMVERWRILQGRIDELEERIARLESGRASASGVIGTRFGSLRFRAGSPDK